MNKAGLIEIIDSYLEPLGFHKKGKSWYKENHETITIFTLDKSRWGEIYYVYLSILFKELSEEKRPKFNKCHGNFRIEHLDEKAEEYLNLESDVDYEFRKERVEQLLDKSLSILKKMETMSGFRQLLKQFDPRFFMLNLESQNYLKAKIK